MFQTRAEFCPARRAAHATAAQSRSFSSQLVAERFYPQFEHAVTVRLKKKNFNFFKKPVDFRKKKKTT